MYKVFQMFFYTGTLFAIVAFVLGHFLNIPHIDAIDLHIDFDIPELFLFPLRPIVLASFSVVFGGVGMKMLDAGIENTITLIVSILSGILVSFSIYRFIIVPLRKAENTSSVSRDEMIGKTARVILGMKDEDFGEIQYTVCGNTYNAPAKSYDKSEILKDSIVTVLSINNDVFYVKNYKGEEAGK